MRDQIFTTMPKPLDGVIQTSEGQPQLRWPEGALLEKLPNIMIPIVDAIIILVKYKMIRTIAGRCKGGTRTDWWSLRHSRIPFSS